MPLSIGSDGSFSCGACIVVKRLCQSIDFHLVGKQTVGFSAGAIASEYEICIVVAEWERGGSVCAGECR